MKNTPENKQAMTKYKELINHLYKEPVIRQFEDVTSQIATLNKHAPCKRGIPGPIFDNMVHAQSIINMADKC